MGPNFEYRDYYLHDFSDLDLLRPHHIQMCRQIGDRVAVDDGEVVNITNTTLLESIAEARAWRTRGLLRSFRRIRGSLDQGVLDLA